MKERNIDQERNGPNDRTPVGGLSACSHTPAGWCSDRSQYNNIYGVLKCQIKLEFIIIYLILYGSIAV